MATDEFLGVAPDVAQVSTVTAGGTFAGSETVSIEIGGAVLTATLGSDTSTDDVAEIMGRMINGDALKNDETRTATGDTLGMFKNITATYSGSVLTLTAVQNQNSGDSEPFTFATDDSGSTSGTLTDATPTSHSGPYDANTAKNWSNGTVPGSGDTAVLAGTGKHLRWGLQSIALASLKKLASFDGDIGLPLINVTSGIAYHEYRTRKLRISGSTCTLEVGDGEGSSMVNIEFNNATTNVVVHKTAQSADQDRPTIEIEDLHEDGNIRIEGGNVGIDTAPDASVCGACDLTIVGKNTVVYTGQGATSLGATHVDGATLHNYCQLGGGTFVHEGGKIISYPNSSITNGMTVYSGGEIDYRGGTVSTGKLTLAGGKFTLENHPSESWTFTPDVEVHAEGSELIDPRGLFGATNIDLNNIGVEDMKTLIVGKNRRLTLGTPS